MHQSAAIIRLNQINHRPFIQAYASYHCQRIIAAYRTLCFYTNWLYNYLHNNINYCYVATPRLLHCYAHTISFLVRSKQSNPTFHPYFLPFKENSCSLLAVFLLRTHSNYHKQCISSYNQKDEKVTKGPSGFQGFLIAIPDRFNYFIFTPSVYFQRQKRKRNIYNC